MATVIKPTAISNFKSRATANSKWMIVVTGNYSICAFEDNTRIFRNGGVDTTLNRQQLSTRTYSAGDVISTDIGKGFSFSGATGGKTGICYAWEGTLFGHRIDRFTPTFYYTATRETAAVTITRKAPGAGTDTVVVNADVVHKDELRTYTASDTDDQYIVTSDKPIAVYVDDIETTTQGSDSLPLFPASKELFGTFSGGGHIINGEAGTNNVIIRASNGTKRNISLSNIGGTNQDNNTGPISAAGNFQNASCKLISDKFMFVESQADYDGGEMTPFVTREAFGTEFVIPEDENEWVKLVSDVPATYEVFDSANVYLGGGSLAGTFYDSARTIGATHPGERVGGIYQVRIGSATEGASNLTQQKNLIRTSAPVYGVFESEDDDETVLFARVKNNSSVHINPKIITEGLVLALDAANKKSYPGSGTTWFDLSGNDNHGTNANMTFETDKLGVFDFNNSTSESTIANSDSLNPVSQLTLEAVVNFDGNSTDFIFEKGNVNTQYSIFSHGTDLVFRTVHQGVAGYDSLYGAKSQGITNGQYHHVLGSYNGSTKKLYIDGKEVATKNKTGNLVTTTPGAAVGDFGGTSTGYPFGGKIALVRVYNIGLSASQVKQNFEAIRGRFGI